MNLIDLETAVSEIQQACEDRQQGRDPFFFLVGAGISKPPINLAAEIEADCRAMAKKYARTVGPIGALPIDTYSHWFNTAFPQPNQRQRYLRELIEGKNISQANFRLAHLLLKRTISNLVVTPNFDDFLSRALALFGTQPIVCDHPLMVERIIPEERKEIQIVHVHGTYWFYDCCNLGSEIARRAEPSALSTATMAALLDSILMNRVPLVIGYSGWEGDVIMTALRRRLNRGLPYRLYWFCYRSENAEQLPDWLISHPDVFLVVPSQKTGTLADLNEIKRSKNLKTRSKLSSRENVHQASDKGSAANLLTGQAVFDAFIRTFELDAPTLTSDPLLFLANHLRASLPQDDKDQPEDNVYRIKKVIERIEMARQKEHAELQTELSESQLEQVRDALRRSQYGEAISIGRTIALESMTIPQLRELIDAEFDAAKTLADNSVDELNGYDLVLAIGNTLKRQEISDPPLLKQVATTLLNRGKVLGELKREGEAIACYDEIINRFGEATQPALLEQVAKALVKKGIVLGELKRHEGEITCYDEVVSRFAEAKESLLLEHVADALVKKGIVLGELKRHEEEITCYDEVVSRFAEAKESLLLEHVGDALFNKGLVLRELKRRDEAIACYDQIDSRFGKAKEHALREQVADALVNKGVVLGELKREEEEIACYDQVIDRFGEAKEVALLEHVADALFNKGLVLRELKRGEEAIACYDQIDSRFGKAKEHALREQIADALLHKGDVLSELKREEEAIACYDQVVNRFGEAKEHALLEHVADALVNKGIALSELRREEEAIACHDEVVIRFGEAKEPILLEQVANALVNKGIVLSKLKRQEEEIACYDQVVDRFGAAKEVALLERVASALLNRGNALGQLDRGPQELQSYEEVVKRFGAYSEPALSEQVADALNSVGFKMLCDAKRLWLENKKHEAHEKLLVAQTNIDSSLERASDSWMAMGNAGYIAFLLGDNTKALALLTQAMKLGGEELRTAELKDANINTLPQDEEFKWLIHSISIANAE
jgi:tetratricopeptide (TPR) repeat protein